MNRRQPLYQIAGEGRLALKDEGRYQAIAVWLYSMFLYQIRVLLTWMTFIFCEFVLLPVGRSLLLFKQITLRSVNVEIIADELTDRCFVSE
jgi:hypothetical protein